MPGATPLEFLRPLVEFPSVSSTSNAAVTRFVEQTLQQLGFTTERLEYVDAAGVPKASVAGRLGTGVGGLAYFGHSDVVPADNWHDPASGPFRAVERDGRVYGRGSCDMKGSLACALAAASRFSAGNLARPFYFVCTADEEVGYHGARQVAAESRYFQDMAAQDVPGIIGEPTQLEVVYAHKGVCGLRATARGRAAHSSTRGGINANLAMIPFLVEMKAIHDETERDPAWLHHEFDPPTVSWNIGINDHTHAVNITPPQSVCTVYFRPMPGQSPQMLIERARRAAQQHGLEFEVPVNAPPLYVDPQSPFVRTCLQLAGRENARTVSYGTDGAMFGALRRLVVCGPGDIAQAHTRDEWIATEQLAAGTDLYARMIERFCTT